MTGARVAATLLWMGLGLALAHAPAPVAAGMLVPATGDQPRPRLAIVMDDIGYHRESTRRTLRLPGALTLAVLPDTPEARTAASLAATHAKEVILHQPMATVIPRPLGPGALTGSMDREALRAELGRNIDACPECVGVSNHMGSLLTTDRAAMQWVMDELAARGLYFMDSRTSGESIAARVARTRAVAVVERDVFLDNRVDRAALERSFADALAIARTQGQAVLIAHPYRETLDFLEQVLPGLDAAGIDQVRLSDLLPDGAGAALLARRAADPTSVPHPASPPGGSRD